MHNFSTDIETVVSNICGQFDEGKLLIHAISNSADQQETFVVVRTTTPDLDIKDVLQKLKSKFPLYFVTRQTSKMDGENEIRIVLPPKIKQEQLATTLSMNKLSQKSITCLIYITAMAGVLSVSRRATELFMQ